MTSKISSNGAPTGTATGYKRPTKPTSTSKPVPAKKPSKKKVLKENMIVNVWADNLKEELGKMM